MSSRTLELLRLVGLLDHHDRVEDLSGLSKEQLRGMLSYYASKRLETARLEVDKAAGGGARLCALVSSVSCRNAVFPLLPSCLVYDKLYVDDPVFALVPAEDGSLARAHKAMLGFPSERMQSVERARNALLFFQELAPLIRLGVVESLPISVLHKPPLHPAITFSKDWFKSAVPAPAHDYVHERAVIREMEPGPGGKGLRVLPRTPSRPVSGIMVSFKGDDPVAHGPFYLYHHTKMTDLDDEGRFELTARLDWEDPPDESMFNTWVYQSVNRAVASRLEAIAEEIALSHHLGASYLTESEFESGLCAKAGEEPVGRPTSADAAKFLRANEPRLVPASPDLVRQLRAENPDLFRRFHESLLEISGRLAGEVDFDEKARQLYHKEVEPQIAEIDKAAAKVKVQAVAGAIVTASSIGLAIASGSVLPLAAIIGFGVSMTIGTTLPSVQEYVSSCNTPAFIWRKITK